MNAVTMHEPTSSEAVKYQTILQRRIDDGARSAMNVIETIHRHQPKDQIVSSRAVRFRPTENGTDAGQRRSVIVNVGDDEYVPSDYALGQIATRAGVPTAYVRELASSQEGWQRELAADIFSRHYSNASGHRILSRSVGGQLRGWLSDRYRRLDSRPLVDALAQVAQDFGAVPIDGVVTETRVALKVVLPRVLEPIPGEFLVYGGEWSNSDYGNGTHSFRSFALRVVCLNGMTRENILREIHLGGRLNDNVAYSERTYRLDTAASVSALQDVVRGALGPGAMESLSQQLRAANEKHMTVAQLRAATKNVGKETQKAIVDAFESKDVINMPAGESTWRASNAVSWIANHTSDAEKRLDLERLAGALV